MTGTPDPTPTIESTTGLRFTLRSIILLTVVMAAILAVSRWIHPQAWPIVATPLCVASVMLFTSQEKLWRGFLYGALPGVALVLAERYDSSRYGAFLLLDDTKMWVGTGLVFIGSGGIAGGMLHALFIRRWVWALILLACLLLLMGAGFFFVLVQ